MALHFHGLHMEGELAQPIERPPLVHESPRPRERARTESMLLGSNHMDGVVGVTQRAISTGQSFNLFLHRGNGSVGNLLVNFFHADIKSGFGLASETNAS